jgi:Spy/CpxP family protein refolding chaperone
VLGITVIAFKGVFVMKKLLIAALVTLIPLALFAQVPAAKPMDRPGDRQIELLKSFKLSDAQIAQVQDIEKSTRTATQSDFAHLQLLNAQIKVALLPSSGNPDLQAVDKLIDQKAQLRAEMEKSLVSAKVQLTQIMGKDNFEKFFRTLRMHMPRRGFFAKKGQFRPPMDGDAEGNGGGIMLGK